MLIVQLGALARRPEAGDGGARRLRAGVPRRDRRRRRRRASDEGPGTTRLVARLVGEETRLTVAAKLRWVQYARAQLRAIARGSASRRAMSLLELEHVSKRYRERAARADRARRRLARGRGRASWPSSGVRALRAHARCCGSPPGSRRPTAAACASRARAARERASGLGDGHRLRRKDAARERRAGRARPGRQRRCSPAASRVERGARARARARSRAPARERCAAMTVGELSGGEALRVCDRADARARTGAARDRRARRRRRALRARRDPRAAPRRSPARASRCSRAPASRASSPAPTAR